MDLTLITQWAQLGFGSIVSGLLIWMVVKYLPRREAEHQEAITSLYEQSQESLEKAQERHKSEMAAYRQEHAELERQAHEKIIEMCTRHDQQVRAALREILYAVLLLNSDISETERVKIRRRLLGED